MIRLTISSANSGLPPERSATCVDLAEPVARSAPGSSAADELAAPGLASAARARSWSRCAGRRPSRGADRAARRGRGRRAAAGRGPSGPGTRSGRAFPRPPSGCPRSPAPAGWPRLHRLDQRADRREHAVAHPLRVLACRGPSGGIERLAGSIPSGRAITAARRSGGSSVSPSGHQLLDALAQLPPGDVGVVGVHDLELPPDAPPRAPSRRSRRRRRGSGRSRIAVAPADSRARRELPQQPRLADARLTDHGDEVGTALAHDPLEQRLSSADSSSRPISGVGRARSAAASSRAPAPGRLPCGDRLRLPLQLERLELARTRSRRRLSR